VRRGDLGEVEAVTAAAASCDAVIHTAARAGVWGPYADFKRANILGTQHVLMACHLAGVKKLVYTSSPSVAFAGWDQENVDESAPYPRHHEAHYPFTKAVAEQLVLQANGPNLATVALRPHLIWGPGDPHLLPRLVERSKAGQLRRVGRRDNLVDATYVDNAAAAHLLALDRLAPGSPIAGKAYFIANGEPVPLWDLINRMLAAVGAPPVTRRISPTLAYLAGMVLEVAYRLLGRQDEPRMTRFLARQLCTHHYFDLTAARRDLGYRPTVTTEVGLKRLAEAPPP
jgi:nucleoside-diphosphate-sugar epimerase